MWDFMVRKGMIRRAQKFIDKQTPKVNIHVPEEIPLPSVRTLKKFVPVVAKINALEETMKAKSDEELKAQT